MRPLRLLALSLLAAAPGWKGEVLSDDPAIRAPALARLHEKGRSGLYALQDLVEKSADDAEHARALRALGELGDPAAEWELLLQLRQPSPHVLAAVVGAAARLRLPNLAHQIAEKVGNPDAELCAALGEAAKIFPAVAEKARAALSSKQPDEQLAGARILVAAGLPLNADIAKQLIGSANPDLRFAAAVALQSGDPDAAIDALAALAGSPHEAEAVALLGKLSTPHALERLQALAADPAHAQVAIAALAGSPGGMRLLLTKRAAADLPTAQATAIDAALNAQPHAPEWLLKLLGDPDDTVARAAAVRLCARPAGLAALARCVETQSSAAPRCAAGLAGSANATVEVARALQSPEPAVRLLMLGAIRAAAQSPTLDELTPLAVDPSDDVRVALPAAVGRLDAAGLPLLQAMVKDVSPAVRQAAATELVRLLPEDKLRAFAAAGLKDSAVRSAVLSAVSRLATADALRLLIADLGAPDAKERRQVMSMLAHYNTPEATQALMDSAAKDADPLLREYALTLLGNQ
jgi:HEAT repeat protein